MKVITAIFLSYSILTSQIWAISPDYPTLWIMANGHPYKVSRLDLVPFNETSRFNSDRKNNGAENIQTLQTYFKKGVTETLNSYEGPRPTFRKTQLMIEDGQGDAEFDQADQEGLVQELCSDIINRLDTTNYLMCLQNSQEQLNIRKWGVVNSFYKKIKEYGSQIGTDEFLANVESKGIPYLQTIAEGFKKDQNKSNFLNNYIREISGLSVLEDSCQQIENHMIQSAPESIRSFLKNVLIAPSNSENNSEPEELSLFSNIPFITCESTELARYLPCFSGLSQPMQEQMIELTKGAQSMATPLFLREVRKMAAKMLQEKACEQTGQIPTFSNSEVTECVDFMRGELSQTQLSCHQKGTLSGLRNELNAPKKLAEYTQNINHALTSIMHIITDFKATEKELSGSFDPTAPLMDPRKIASLEEINKLRERKIFEYVALYPQLSLNFQPINSLISNFENAFPDFSKLSNAEVIKMIEDYQQSLIMQYKSNLLKTCNPSKIRTEAPSIYDILSSAPQVAERVLKEHPEFQISYNCALKEAKEAQDYQTSSGVFVDTACTVTSSIPFLSIGAGVSCSGGEILSSVLNSHIAAQTSQFNQLISEFDAEAEATKRESEQALEGSATDILVEGASEFFGGKFKLVEQSLEIYDKVSGASEKLQTARDFVGEDSLFSLLGATEIEVCTEAYFQEMKLYLEEIKKKRTVNCKQKSQLENLFLYFSKCGDTFNLQEYEYATYKYYEFVNSRCN